MSESRATVGEPVGTARKPVWLRRMLPAGGNKLAVVREIDNSRLVTVCDEARCPNRGECFARGTATFLVLGEVCSRGCRFCSVSKGTCSAPDPDEPQRVADAAARMKLSHVVVTSVTRDDLPDGGAAHFAQIVKCVRATCPGASVEILIPDFGGSVQSVQTALDSCPDVFNHNVETVPRLYPLVRPQADFERSLRVLEQGAGDGRCVVKSGMMVGLGETEEEVVATMQRVRESGCSVLTIGQYLQPSPQQLAVAAYIEPQQFDWYRDRGLAIGFSQVAAGPFVRSSYRAAEVFRSL